MPVTLLLRTTYPFPTQFSIQPLIVEGNALQLPHLRCLNQQHPLLVCCRLRTPIWNRTRSLHFPVLALPHLPMRETAISYRLRFNPHSLPYHEPTVHQCFNLPSKLSTQSSAVSSLIKTSIPPSSSAKTTSCSHLATFDYREQCCVHLRQRCLPYPNSTSTAVIVNRSSRTRQSASIIPCLRADSSHILHWAERKFLSGSPESAIAPTVKTFFSQRNCTITIYLCPYTDSFAGPGADAAKGEWKNVVIFWNPNEPVRLCGRAAAYARSGLTGSKRDTSECCRASGGCCWCKYKWSKGSSYTTKRRGGKISLPTL